MRLLAILKRPRTLSHLLTAYAGGGLFVLAAVFGIVLQLSVSRFLHDSLQDKAEALARQLAVVALDATILRDYGSLERYVTDVVRERDVLWVRVRRDDGDILGEASRAGRDGHSRHSERVTAPIRLLDNTLGEVTIEYDTGRVRHSIVLLTVIGLAGIFVLTLVLFLVVRRLLDHGLIAPIRRLAQQVSPLNPTGKLASSADEPEEIRQLAEPFSRLRAEIDEYVRRLEKANRVSRAATERLCREQRLASIGQLAAGLAHGLNTPLGNIAGYAQMGLRSTDEPHTSERLAVIAKQAEVCSTIVRNLMMAARQPDPVGVEVDLEVLVRGTAQLIAPLLRDKGVGQIDVIAENGPYLAWADPAAIEQILFNLLSNAAHAGCGSITIRLEADAGTVTILVADDGQGIPPAIQAKLFEPFQTSKAPGHGTGLGLYIAATLARSMDGSVALVDSVAGKTTFAIHLPITRAHLGGMICAAHC